jgi:hypothetical protein
MGENVLYGKEKSSNKSRKGKISTNRVNALLCLFSRRIRNQAEVHHIRKHTGMGLRPPHSDTIPLCHSHHRTGKISVHLGKKEFEKKYGTEQEILKKINREIKWEQENQDIL